MVFAAEALDDSRGLWFRLGGKFSRWGFLLLLLFFLLSYESEYHDDELLGSSEMFRSLARRFGASYVL